MLCCPRTTLLCPGQFTLHTPAPTPSVAGSSVSSPLQARGEEERAAMGSANCLAQTNALFRKNLVIQVTSPRSTPLVRQISLPVSGIWWIPLLLEIFFFEVFASEDSVRPAGSCEFRGTVDECSFICFVPRGQDSIFLPCHI